MARDQQLVRANGPFLHRPITGSGLLKAGTLVDALDVVDQVVFVGEVNRARVYFKTAAGVAGSLAFKVVRPGGTVVGTYDTPLIAAVPITANTEAVIDLAATDLFGESQLLLEFTGDGGIVTPGAILYADICGAP